MKAMKVITVDFYKLEDLPDGAKERAYQEWLQSDPCNADPVITSLIAQAEMLGITVDQIYYTGFYSQGDGACFDGRYAYNPQWRDAFKINYGLGLLGQFLHNVQAINGFKITAAVKHDSGCRYYHANSVDITVGGVTPEPAIEMVENYIREFMHYIYKTLQLDYELQTSVETFEEAAEVEGMVFTIDGKNFDYL